VKAYLHGFLASVLERSEWRSSCHSSFYPWRKSLHTYRTGGWESRRTKLDKLAKRKITTPAENRTAVVQPTVSHSIYWAILAHSLVIRLNWRKVINEKTTGRFPLEVYDDGILMQVLCLWTLFVVLFFFSVTDFCLRLHVEPTQFGPIDKASPYLRTSASTQNRTYKPRTA
jgi:hypothetical protein